MVILGTILGDVSFQVMPIVSIRVASALLLWCISLNYAKQLYRFVKIVECRSLSYQTTATDYSLHWRDRIAEDRTGIKLALPTINNSQSSQNGRLQSY
jgi:hypothetical protein